MRNKRETGRSNDFPTTPVHRRTNGITKIGGRCFPIDLLFIDDFLFEIFAKREFWKKEMMKRSTLHRFRESLIRGKLEKLIEETKNGSASTSPYFLLKRAVVRSSDREIDRGALVSSE